MTDSDREHSLPYPEIRTVECKGCGRCLLACPHDLLRLSEELNRRGYRYAVYCGEGCTGCANCYYTCPEPAAIAVHLADKERRPPEGRENS